MGRLDEKLKNTWPQLHLVSVILKGSWNKYGTKSWTRVIYIIILNNYMAPPRLGSFWVQALLRKQCSHQVSLKFRSLIELYPQFFESILWPCQWAMCIKDTTFHQPTKQRSKRLTCLTEILTPIGCTRKNLRSSRCGCNDLPVAPWVYNFEALM